MAGLTKDVREFNKILKAIPEDKKYIGENLVSELKFMSATLADLKKQVTENGTVELFEQGKQKFTRESPALKSYNTTVQRYSLLYKQLTDLLPKTVETKGSNELLDFIKEN